MKNKHLEHYGADENFERVALVQSFIEETNRHIGKSFLNSKSEGTYDQADSWMPYLWYIRTADLPQVYEHAVHSRTNPSSQLTLQNIADASRALINSNRISALRTNGTNPNCPNCRGLGWEYLEVWLTPRGDEFSAPELCTVVDRCNCDAYQQDQDHLAPTPLVGKLMRLLAGQHPDGIPNVEREQRAAQKLAEFGYDFADIFAFLDGNEPQSLVPVVKGIGAWQFKREMQSLGIQSPLSQVAALAVQVVESGGMTEAQMKADSARRERFAREIQQENLCETCD